jgi:hypothetical protein
MPVTSPPRRTTSTAACTSPDRLGYATAKPTRQVNRALDPRPLISHRFNLADTGLALTVLGDRERTAVKVLIRPNGGPA